MTRVSVLLPIYKERTEWIRLAIESILFQTFSDFELIIIDDNPEDTRNKLLIQEYQLQDCRVVALLNDFNIGLQASLNKGVKIVRGEYVARMDADDVSIPTRFEKQVSFLDTHSDYGICGTNAIGIDKDGKKIRKIVLPSSDEALKSWQLFFVPFIHPSTMIRANLLKEKQYDEEVKTAEDADLWLRLKDKTKFYNIPEYLLYYRIHEQNTSGRNNIDVLMHSSKMWYERRYNKFQLDSHYKNLYLRCVFEWSYGSSVFSPKLTNKDFDTLFAYLLKVYYTNTCFYDVILWVYLISCIKGYRWYKLLLNPFSKKNPFIYIKHLLLLIRRKCANIPLVVSKTV